MTFLPRILLVLAAATLLSPSWAQPLAMPALAKSAGLLGEGTDWETEYFIVDSGRAGPTVLVVGGMHGNEPAGSVAAEQIRHWPIVKGKLVVLPRASVQALAAKSRRIPGVPRERANLNRNFPEVEEEGVNKVVPRGPLSAALWTFAFEVKPDWLIDLHEGYEFNRSHKPAPGKTKSVGSSVIYRGSPEMDSLMKRVVAAADELVADPENRFTQIRRGPVVTGLARACINMMGAEGMILETTYTNQPMALRTGQHRAMVSVLFQHIGITDRDCRDIVAAP